jgi:hypothetical protein
MEMWQRYWSFKIWDFAVLGRVIRNKGRFLFALPSEGDWREVICLTLITSDPRVTSPSEMSSAGVLEGR